MLHIMFTLHIYDLTVISACGGVGGEAYGEKSAKPVTAVPDRISTFVSVKPPLSLGDRNISRCVCSDQDRYFKPEHDLSPVRFCA